jgi:TrmH family RNA methyltransferase
MIKRIRHLQKKKYREKYREYTIEGVRIIEDALQNNTNQIKYVFFCDELLENSRGEALLHNLQEKKISLYRLPSKLFIKFSDTQNPQGIMAILSFNAYNIEDLLASEMDLFILLDRIQDPGNLGTIIRTADAAGVDAVLLTKGCVDLYNAKTIRSTMGSIFHLPIVYIDSTCEMIGKMKKNHIKIVSTSLDTNHYYYEIDLKTKVAIIIGNEANGVLTDVLESSDEIVKIPVIGKAESLNASVAASIMMYEVVRQRHSHSQNVRKI